MWPWAPPDSSETQKIPGSLHIPEELGTDNFKDGAEKIEDAADEDVDTRESLDTPNWNVNQCSYYLWKSVWGFSKI